MAYTNNHYVPVWYQKRFLMAERAEKKYFYLDLKPETCRSNGHVFRREAIRLLGPASCFSQEHLYTTTFDGKISTEIEEKFFGKVDDSARPALDYFADFAHPSADEEAFHTLLTYMSLQKLRTPKGLQYLQSITKAKSKNRVLLHLQRLQQLYCANWTECVWQLADASHSATKFIVSDHPVTVYNQGAFPNSPFCTNGRDPDIWLSGTKTLFPLNESKILILTNLSWVRDPYSNPIKTRPNANPFRAAMFNFTAIQTHRTLLESEVIQINHIIKSRAYRFIAAAQKEWLYPERQMEIPRWDNLGKNYLLMPDPRSVIFGGQIVVGYKNRAADVFDEYGRRPDQAGFKDGNRHVREWETFHAFQGEFARKFGKSRRGRSFEFMKLSNEEDSDDFHSYNLSLETKHKKNRYNQ